MIGCHALSLVSRLLLLCALCSLLIARANAQSASATLSGTVEDTNGAVIPGVSITVTNNATGAQRQTTTNAEGYFVVPLLPPSRYQITAQNQGFTTVRIPEVVLNVGDQKALQIQLKAGDVNATVQVVNEAPLINESPAVGTVVDRQFVENMPLNGRSFQALIALTPGVVLTKATVAEQGQFSVNGQRANANYFMVDGVSANVGVSAGFGLAQSANGSLPALGASGGTNTLVSVDAMQEFNVQTSTFAPEFGRTPGAQISIATRSGTNEFHGTIFDYFRNDALDANDWFANSRGLPKPALRQNDFGGVLGGPLYLPRFGEGGRALYSGRNRTFFFFSYEGLRLRLPQTRVTLVPSVASRQAAVPQMQPILNAFPVPNGQVFGNGFAEFNATFSDPLNLDATSLRIDHAVSNKFAIFGRYNYAPSKSSQRGIVDLGASSNSITHTKFKTQTLTIKATHSVNSAITNEIGINYSKNDGTSGFEIDNLGGAVPFPDSAVFPPFAARQDASLFIGFAGGNTLSLGKNVKNTQRQINLVDNLSVLTGAHQLKFGVDYRLLLPINSPNAYTQFVNFSNPATLPGPVTGIADSVSVRGAETVPLRVTNFSAYFQDTWKTSPRLAITYGLRWDVNPAPKGRDGKPLFTVDNLSNLASLSYAPSGTPLYETTYDNFAPRLGIACQLFRKSGRETLIRGGFGIFYDLGLGSVGNSAASLPHTRSSSFFSVPYPLTLAQATPPPINTGAVTGGQLSIADRNLELPRTYQWNLAIEQSLGSNQTVSATYVGAAGRELLRSRTISTPSGTFIFLTENTATSDYHAMQIQFQRRLSRGLQVLASHTWSHSIDTASIDSLAGSTPRNPSSDRGDSNFDVRHAFSAAVTYNIPAPAWGKAGKAIFKDWSLDSIATARSATPVDLAARTDLTGGILTRVRPNLIPSVPLYVDDPTAPGGRRFNASVPTSAQVAAAGCVAPTATNAKGAFCTPLAGQQGNFGRNVMRSFSVFQVDFALRRQFNLGERLNLQLRAEAFNLFNHPNFGDPIGTLTSPLFGRTITTLATSLGAGGGTGGFSPLYQVGGPRSVQLALKLTF